MVKTEDWTREDLEQALGGDAPGLRKLIDRLTPIVQVRVARVLLRRRPSLHGQQLRQEVEDLIQDVMLSLFTAGARVLRLWDPSRGLSLANYVGMVAERHAATILKSRKKTWPAELRPDEELDGPTDRQDPEQQAAARQTLGQMLALLERELSDQGFELFKLLFVEELTVPEIRERTGLSDDAIYAWRSRLRRKTRSLMHRSHPTPAAGASR
ncbi:MAG: sigma-70 family RNA polymerase sigma factor [Acidobacteriota bacterium]